MSYKTWDPSAYADGPLQIGFQGYVPPSGVGFIEASSEALRIPIVEDYNTGNSTGVKQGTGHLDSRFHRSSSYDSYLKQAINRTNLDVLYFAPVWKINFNATGERPKATGVAFMDHPTGMVHEITARKEVIVSSGAFNSPQLLMVSVSRHRQEARPGRGRNLTRPRESDPRTSWRNSASSRSSSTRTSANSTSPPHFLTCPKPRHMDRTGR